MLSYLKDILENREDAYPRALAIADRQIAQTGGAWFGAGMKGCVLLMKSSTYRRRQDGAHYARAGLALLHPALQAAKVEAGLDVDVLNFMSGCAFGASVQESGHFEHAKSQFALCDGTAEHFETWCSHWRSIILASAAQDVGALAEAKAYFKELADCDPMLAARYFEAWQQRVSVESSHSEKSSQL